MATLFLFYVMLRWCEFAERQWRSTSEWSPYYMDRFSADKQWAALTATPSITHSFTGPYTLYVNLDLINTTLLDMTRFGAFRALLNAECSLYLEISQTSCCPTFGRYWNPADPQSLPWKRIKEVFLIFQLFVLEIIKCMRNREQIDGNDLPSQN